MNVGDKMFVSDWGKVYSDFYRCLNPTFSGTWLLTLLKELSLNESMRQFLASQPDEVLLSNSGFVCIRKGYYKIQNLKL